MRSPLRERLPESLTLKQVATDFGLELTSCNGVYYRCPFHVDNKRPNLRLYNPDSRDGHFYCFGCGAKSDLIDWVGRKRNLSDLEAYKLIRDHYGLGNDKILESEALLAEHGNIVIHRVQLLSDTEIEELGAPKNFNLDALRKAQFSNVLRMVKKYKGKKVYVLMDPHWRIALVRPFDGSTWDCGEKALVARRSNIGIPVGIHSIGRYDAAVMVEGGPDYLRVLSVLYEQGKLEKILPLMMVTGSATIYPGVLSSLRLKRVRILGQNDECGVAAAARWRRQLMGAGADVDVWVAPKIALPGGLHTKDIDEIYWKVDEKRRQQVQELHEIFNLDARISSANLGK